MSKHIVTVAALALMSGAAQAQINEQLKQRLEPALKTVDAPSGRMQALEAERDRVKPAPPAAGTASQWGAPVVSPAVQPEDAQEPGADKALVEVYGQDRSTECAALYASHFGVLDGPMMGFYRFQAIPE